MNGSDSPNAIRITGGRVIDPGNAGSAVRDVLLAGGKVVDRLPPGPCRTIDAAGRVVLPGSIDMHTHLLSRGAAAALPDPPPDQLAADYLRMGTTCVVDAAVPGEEIDFARDRLAGLAGLEAGYLVEIADRSALAGAAEAGGRRAVADELAALVDRPGAVGVKLVSAGSDDDNVPHFAKLVRTLADAVDRLGLAHPLHVHAPRLGLPGNVDSTADLLERVRPSRMHLAHAQFYACGATAKGRFASGAARLAAVLAREAQITCDAGCVSFGSARMVSRDAALGERLSRVTGQPIRGEAGWQVLELAYDPARPIAAVQWATGLELILRSAGSPRLAMSVDHPSGGWFTRTPELLRCLADADHRAEVLGRVHRAAAERTGLPELAGRTLSAEELVMLTRVAPARALGLAGKGHLRPGADADVVIADAVHAPAAEWVVAGGRIAVERGRVIPREPGRELGRSS